MSDFCLILSDFIELKKNLTTYLESVLFLCYSRVDFFMLSFCRPNISHPTFKRRSDGRQGRAALENVSAKQPISPRGKQEAGGHFRRPRLPAGRLSNEAVRPPPESEVYPADAFPGLFLARAASDGRSLTDWSGSGFFSSLPSFPEKNQEGSYGLIENRRTGKKLRSAAGAG